jgi:hypothetical protein
MTSTPPTKRGFLFPPYIFSNLLYPLYVDKIFWEKFEKNGGRPPYSKNKFSGKILKNPSIYNKIEL